MRYGQHGRRTARSDRWKREDDAPRLRELVSELESLRLELEESSAGRRIPGTNRIQHVVVAQASTRFEVPCGDEKCEDGGHDLTREVMASLRGRATASRGSDACGGHVGERPCGRVLEYVLSAKYS